MPTELPSKPLMTLVLIALAKAVPVRAQLAGDQPWLCVTEEIHGKPVNAGESFSATHIVGYFDSIDEMHKVYDRYKGHTALTADRSGWRLEK